MQMSMFYGIWIAWGLSMAVHAQPFRPDTLQTEDSLRVIALPPLVVEATRGTTTRLGDALPLLTLTRRGPEIALTPSLTLTETLRELPGLWLNDRQNYALGERLIIRSAGWQAAFGLRGVQVILDGIPLTMPDGQAVLDPVDPVFVRRAELLRGPSAVFWGNGSGGALVLSTWPEPLQPGVRGRLITGSYGLRRIDGEVATRLGPHALVVHASHLDQEGYRVYSHTRLTRLGLQTHFGLTPSSLLRLSAAAAWLDAEHPGSLTAEEVARNPRQASTRNIQTRAGKTSRQAQLGATFMQYAETHTANFSLFGLLRQLDNPLPYAYIQLQRQAAGMRTTVTRTLTSWRFSAGLDFMLQDDKRKNFTNQTGRPGPTPLLDQQERVSELALFALGQHELSAALSFLAGLRMSYLYFTLSDYRFVDGDQSGHRRFMAWTPVIGVHYRLQATQELFATFGTAFESPTTTELVNRPDGHSGFNPELKPQQLYGFELGWRHHSSKLQADLTLFYQWVRGRLLPFQLEADGRTFYRNAGRSRQYGLEAWLQAQLLPKLQVRASYTGGRFRFEDAALRGNHIPGLPSHRGFLALRYMPGPLWIESTATAVGPFYADDANRIRVSGYVIFDLTLGAQRSLVAGFRVQPFVSVQNVSNRHYVGSVVVNAGGGRYFEPAVPRSLRFGLTIGTL